MRIAVLALVLCVGACATYQEDLNRGQRFYTENEYERALSIFRVLEEDMDSLSLNDQARYSYLRGMTDYRLGFRADARHWLAIAKATEQEHPGGLSGDWKQRLEEALADLNRDVYGGAESVDKTASTAVERPMPAPEAGPPGCQTDTDCSGAQSCQGGQCVPL
jgi:hypothetical protein